MKPARTVLSAVVLSLLIVAGCDTAEEVSPQGLSYARDVAPLVARRCTSCHSPGSLAPFSLVTHADVARYARRIVPAITSGAMPPWRAVPSDDCSPTRPFVGDDRLTLAEIETITRWVDAGAIDDSKGRVAAVPVPPRLERVDLDLGLTEPFSVPQGADTYRCFVLDPKLTKDVYLAGIDVAVDNRAVIHHATVLADPERASLAHAPIGGSFDCKAGGLDATEYSLNAWTPGQLPTTFPADAGPVLPRDTLIVVQIHYSSKSGVQRDQSHIQMQFREAAPARNMTFQLVGDLVSPLPDGEGLAPGEGGEVEFRIPLGAERHKESMSLTVQPGFTGIIHGVKTHAHYAAVDTKVWLQKAGSDRRECLLRDKWDSHWQRIYTYDVPEAELPRLDVGDRVFVECTFDNSQNNAALASEFGGRRMPRSDIRWGPESTDEMCHTVFSLIRPR